MELIRTAPAPAPLVPRIPDYADPSATPRYQATDLKDGDLVHFRDDVFGNDPDNPLFRKGSVVTVLGFCRANDLNGLPYAVRLYLPGFDTTWGAREARRFPAALQEEVCFSYPPERFTELDLTDHVHVLALERREGAKIIQMYPKPAHVLRSAA